MPIWSSMDSFRLPSLLNQGVVINTDLLRIEADGDNILYFDFHPFNAEKIMGRRVKLQLCTVPGETRFDATWQLALRGAHGIVFVADSMATRREMNFKSLKNSMVAKLKSILY